MKVFLDTNVLVAASVQEHEHHTRAVPVVDAVHSGQMAGCVSAHSLLEAHSILTRLPRSPRITPAQASMLLKENVVKQFQVVGLTPKEYCDLVERVGELGIFGGQVYDALLLQCARKSGADRIFTFNVRHFAALGHDLASKVVAP